MTTAHTQHPFRRSSHLVYLCLISIIIGCVLLSLPQQATASTTAGITLSPGSLQYSGTVGGPILTAGVTITNTTSAALTVSWQDNIYWLVGTSGDTVSIPPGGSKSITHTASTVNLWPGTFKGVATVTGGGVTKKLPVSITVTKGDPTVPSTGTVPSIGLAPGNLSFSGTVGGTNPSAKSISVSNSGGGTLTWTASDNAAWLTLTPAAGTNSGTLATSVNLTGLAAGTYSGTITIAASGAANKTLPVSLTVNPATTTTSPVIGLGQTSLAFTGTAGGTNPATQSVTVANAGTGTLTWTASDNAAWLTLTPAAGTNSGTLAASVNLTGLAAGTYSGTITIAANGAASKTLPVSLTVNTATTSTSSATLSWVLNKETDLSGYKVYMGTRSGVYNAPIDVGKVATYQVNNLAKGTTYFFTITAYDTTGNESSPTAELSKSIF